MFVRLADLVCPLFWRDRTEFCTVMSNTPRVHRPGLRIPPIVLISTLIACSGPVEDRAASPAPLAPQAPKPEPDAEPVSEEPASSPEPFIALTPTRIDCLAKGAPSWCKKLRYATKSERKGTLVALLSADDAEEFYWCADGHFFGEVARHGVDLDTSVTGADVLTLEPRTSTTAYRYFFNAKGTPAVVPKWGAACPV